MTTRVALILLALAPCAVAGEHDDIVSRAFAALDNNFERSWAFTETTIQEGVEFSARYDPRRPRGERWSLLSIDGRTPTEEEAEDYEDDKGMEFDWDDDGDGNDIVDFDTLDLVEETSDYWIFSFIPVPDDDDDDIGSRFMESVNGTLKVVRDGHFLEYLDLRIDEPINPAFSVRISRFLTRLTFGPATEGGPVVPHSVDVEIKGRALLIVTFDEVEAIRYSDYEYVGG